MKNEILKRLSSFSPPQDHLLAFWETLSSVERQRLVEEIIGLDLPLVTRLFAGHDDAPDWRSLAEQASPPPAIRLDGANRFSAQQARERGIAALRAGQVGMILVAGGQGTRLGFPHPKGMFPLGPVSHRTLFQILIEHLRAVSRRYAVKIPLYLMTSPATHNETVAFLAEHDQFGLAKEDLHVFCQGTMPAVDRTTGRVLLDEPGHIALSPDGHGGMLTALEQSGGLADVRRRGIELLYYGQVDNPLQQVCGAELLGYHLLADSEMTTQVVRKRHALEKVGNVVSLDDQVRIIEYSDLPEPVAQRTNSDGSLQLWAGNIAVHVFSVPFLERMAADVESLPFHRAQKKTPTIGANGQRVEPRENNSIKFERFIFDLLPAARNAIVVEADAADSFAPVKNADNEPTDTPTTARAAMIAQHTRWLTAAGATVAQNATVEINPLFALDETELAQKLPRGEIIEQMCYWNESKP